MNHERELLHRQASDFIVPDAIRASFNAAFGIFTNKTAAVELHELI
jgi:hypothetical protein